jgi:hypothetical protein
MDTAALLRWFEKRVRLSGLLLDLTPKKVKGVEHMYKRNVILLSSVCVFLFVYGCSKDTGVKPEKRETVSEVISGVRQEVRGPLTLDDIRLSAELSDVMKNKVVSIQSAQCSSTAGPFPAEFLFDGGEKDTGECAWHGGPPPQWVEVTTASPIKPWGLCIQMQRGPATNIPRSPKDIKIQGVGIDGNVVELGEYELPIPTSPGQYFIIRFAETEHPISGIKVMIETNHGSPDLTTIEEITVLGDEA